jgi:SAM-dependent methyltransferase
VVGLPSKNPWSLPFAHKAIFGEEADRYDLFVYSEDDICVTEANINAFLKATPQLKTDEIAGFLRYEVDQCGRRFLDEPWGHYHWKPQSVAQRGTYTVAEFTNEHSGFYILTQSQLKCAVASGGFLRGPCSGRYGLPETAATDPYTNCGFRKVICISALEDFLIHHASNRYVDGLPVSFEAFKLQTERLLAIRDGLHPASTLGVFESTFLTGWWSKSYYEKPSEELLASIPDGARNILSIGCGWGATEMILRERGAEISVLPLDSVIGGVAEKPGIEVIHGTWEEGVSRLNGRKFDCVLMTNLIHLFPNPEQVLGKCAQFIREGGSLVLSGPNFNRVHWRIKRTCGIGEFRKLRDFGSSGISVCGPATLARPLREAGLRTAEVKWVDHLIHRRIPAGEGLRLGSLTGRDWILLAERA